MKKSLKKLILLLGVINISISLKANYVYALELKNSEKNSAYSEGWNYDNGNWIYIKDGAVKTNWFKDIDGEWYYFNDDGIMQTGWILDNSNWYYLKDNGEMAHECYIGDYYLNNNGAWTNNVPNNKKSTLDINSQMKNLGYSSVERIVDYSSVDEKYSEAYRYTWYDGKDGDEEYAVVNVFDSGSCSILIRKNGTMFNENLKQIFDYILPGNGEKLLNEISGIKDDKSLDIDGRQITIKIFDDSIGIVID